MAGACRHAPRRVRAAPRWPDAVRIGGYALAARRIETPAVVRARRTGAARLYIITIMRSRNAVYQCNQRLARAPFHFCARQRPPEASFNALRTARTARNRPQDGREPARAAGSRLKMYSEYCLSQKLEDASRVHILAACCGAVIPSLCSARRSLSISIRCA